MSDNFYDEKIAFYQGMKEFEEKVDELVETRAAKDERLSKEDLTNKEGALIYDEIRDKVLTELQGVPCEVWRNMKE